MTPEKKEKDLKKTSKQGMQSIAIIIPFLPHILASWFSVKKQLCRLKTPCQTGRLTDRQTTGRKHDEGKEGVVQLSNGKLPQAPMVFEGGSGITYVHR